MSQKLLLEPILGDFYNCCLARARQFTFDLKLYYYMEIFAACSGIFRRVMDCVVGILFLLYSRNLQNCLVIKCRFSHGCEIMFALQVHAYAVGHGLTRQ